MVSAGTRCRPCPTVLLTSLPSLFPPSWKPYPDYITSTNTTYPFTDDGSKTGGLGGSRFYRFFLLP